MVASAREQQVQVVVESGGSSRPGTLLSVTERGLLVWMPEPCPPGAVDVRVGGSTGVGAIRVSGRAERQGTDQVLIVTPGLRAHARVRIREMLDGVGPTATPPPLAVATPSRQPTPAPVRLPLATRPASAATPRPAATAAASPAPISRSPSPRPQRPAKTPSPLVEPDRLKTLVADCHLQAVESVISSRPDLTGPVVDLFGFPRRGRDEPLILRVAVPGGVVYVETSVLNMKGNAAHARLRTSVDQVRAWLGEAP